LLKQNSKHPREMVITPKASTSLFIYIYLAHLLPDDAALFVSHVVDLVKNDPLDLPHHLGAWNAQTQRKRIEYYLHTYIYIYIYIYIYTVGVE